MSGSEMEVPAEAQDPCRSARILLHNGHLAFTARCGAVGGYERSDGMANDSATGNKAWSWWYVLLVIPFIATLWVPFYGAPNSGRSLSGMPFFYWSMFLCLI